MALTGYQVAFALATLFGLLSIYAFARIEEPSRRVLPAPAEGSAPESISWWRSVKAEKQFLRFCGLSTFWTFAVNIASPFFFVFLIDEVGATPATLGVASAVSMFAALPAQRLFGVLTERKGSAWVRNISGYLIPITTLLWPFMQHPWHSFPLQVLGGFAWAGYNLAAFNLLLEMTPDEARPTFVAFFQALTGLGMAAGAALGGLLADRVGYTPVFLLSAGGRLLATVLFAGVIARKSARAKQWVGRQRSEFRRSRKIKRTTKEPADDKDAAGTESLPRADRSRAHGKSPGSAVQSGRDARPVDAGGARTDGGADH